MKKIVQKKQTREHVLSEKLFLVFSRFQKYEFLEKANFDFSRLLIISFKKNTFVLAISNQIKLTKPGTRLVFWKSIIVGLLISLSGKHQTKPLS
jgi:hypothetical protein